MKHLNTTTKEFWQKSVAYYWRQRNDSKTRDDWKENDNMLGVCLDRVRAKTKGMIRSRVLTLVVVVNIIVLLSIILTGCNMVAGAGKDITWIGVAGQEMLEHGHESMEE